MNTNPDANPIAFMVILVGGLGGAFVVVHLVPLWFVRTKAPGSDEDAAA